MRFVRAVVPAGSTPEFSGLSVRDPALERRLAGLYVIAVALLMIPAIIGPSVALGRAELALVGGIGLAFGAIIAAGSHELSRWVVAPAGIAVNILVAADALVDRSLWPAFATLLAVHVLWFATFHGTKIAMFEAVVGAACFGVTAYFHDGIVTAVAVGTLVAMTLAAIVAILARLQGGAAGVLARDREAFERRLVEGESKLRDTEARYRQLIEALPIVTYISSIGAQDSRQYVSPQIEELLGYPVTEWTEKTWEQALHAEERERVLAARAYHIETCTPYRDEYRIQRGDGSTLWVHDEAVVEVDDRGKPVQIRGYLQEITDRRRLEEQLAHRALHDPLTGLPNRTLLLERLQHWASRRTPCSIAVLTSISTTSSTSTTGSDTLPAMRCSTRPLVASRRACVPRTRSAGSEATSSRSCSRRSSRWTLRCRREDHHRDLDGAVLGRRAGLVLGASVGIPQARGQAGSPPTSSSTTRTWRCTRPRARARARPPCTPSR